jgi:hypothetical protein
MMFLRMTRDHFHSHVFFLDLRELELLDSAMSPALQFIRVCNRAPFYPWGKRCTGKPLVRSHNALVRVESQRLDIRAYGLELFGREVPAFKLVPRSEKRNSIEPNDEHDRSVVPAAHPGQRQAGRPTYYVANPTISIRSSWP